MLDVLLKKEKSTVKSIELHRHGSLAVNVYSTRERTIKCTKCTMDTVQGIGLHLETLTFCLSLWELTVITPFAESDNSSEKASPADHHSEFEK